MIAVALVIILVLSGAIIMGVLWRFLSRQATQATVHLQSLSQDYLLKQDELKQRLEQSEHTYQEQLVKVRSESEQTKRKALEEAEAIRQKLMAQAREEYEKIVQKGIDTRDAMKRDQEQVVNLRAIERAGELVQRLLPDDFRQIVQAQWVDRLLENGLVDASQFPTRDEKTKEAKVTSAYPLNTDQRKRLLERLRGALGPDVILREQVDAALVAGLTITVGHVVFDGSLAGKLREAVRDVRGTSE